MSDGALYWEFLPVPGELEKAFDYAQDFAAIRVRDGLTNFAIAGIDLRAILEESPGVEAFIVTVRPEYPEGMIGLPSTDRLGRKTTGEGP